MSEDKKEFIGYEYKETIVREEYVTIYQDGYENFGWSLEGTYTTPEHVGCVTMKFKRDRKLKNKLEISKLQRQFDEIISQVERLERKKELKASTVAYIIGVVAAVLFACAILAFTVWKNIVVMVVLGIPALIGFVLSYVIYTKIRKSKVQEITPLIDEKYDELYQVTMQANNLLQSI